MFKCGILCDTTNDYTPHIIIGLARAVRHYNSEYILSLGKKSAFQIEALESKIGVDDIVEKSIRIKLTNDLDE